MTRAEFAAFEALCNFVSDLSMSIETHVKIPSYVGDRQKLRRAILDLAAEVASHD